MLPPTERPGWPMPYNAARGTGAGLSGPRADSGPGAMAMIRSRLFVILFYTWTVICVLSVWPAMIYSKPAGRQAIQVWCGGVLFLLRWVAKVRYEVRGLDNVPKTPCLIACKHQSAWEIFALMRVIPTTVFVMKQELMRVPLFGRYARRAGMVAVDRSRAGAALRGITEPAARELEEGYHVVVFPEGTRRPVGAPPDYKSGIAHFYRQFGVPCVPAALNSGCHWPGRGHRVHPGTIVLSFLPAIPPGERPKAFLAQLVAQIEQETDRLIAKDGGTGPDAAPVASRP